MLLYHILGLLFFFQYARAVKEVCCDAEIGCFKDEFPYDHLPLPKCPHQIGPQFRLYTREHRRNEEFITRDHIPSTFSPLRRTILLIHGYYNGGKEWWLNESRRRLLDRGDYNVIQVGWRGGSHEIWYWQSAGNTRAVAAETALIVDRLKTFTGISADLLWCVGHSLGAHTCGQVAMRTAMARVTGLDPAGPGWEDYDISAGVNPDVANFVDIIHTDGKSLIISYGQMRPLGHYDFYPNGGHGQPGCITYYAQDQDEKDMRNDFIACDHNRVLYLWIESISDDCFIAREICPDVDDIPRSCYDCGGGRPCAYMGYAAETSPGEPGMYYLKTGNGWFWTRYCHG